MEQEQISQEEKQKILDTFFKDGKIEQMPSKASKRVVLWEKVASMLEDDKEYTEFELTKFLKPIYYDFCTLRRDLVDNGFLTRENGTYKKAK